MTNKYRVEFDNKRQSRPLDPQDVSADSYLIHSDASLRFFLSGTEEPIKSYAPGFWGSVELVEPTPKPAAGYPQGGYGLGTGGGPGGGGGGGGTVFISPGGAKAES